MRILSAILCAGLVAITGCKAPDPSHIVVRKSTVFGLDIAYDGQMPHVRFGLIRYYYQEIPTSTNYVFAPIYNSDTTADLGLTHQSAIERFSTGTSNFVFITPPPANTNTLIPVVK